MQQKFLAANGEKPQRVKPSPQPRARKPLKRGKGFQEVSPERRGFWHGVMATKLRMQEGPFYRCQCGDPDCDAVIEGFEEARRFFVPGHVKPRASFNHRGFRFGYIANLGPDDPDNIVPVTPECNKREFWRRVS